MTINAIFGEAFIKIGSIVDGFEEDLKKKLDPAISHISVDLSTGLGSALSDVGSGLDDLRKPLLGIAAGGQLMFNTFHSGLERIRIDTGATGAQLESLIGSAKKVASQVTVPFDEVAESLALVFRRTGLTGDALEAMTKKVLDLANLFEFDASDNIDTFVKLLTGWRIETGKQSEALDFLFRASQKSGTGILQLVDNAQQGRQALQSLGFSFEDSVALSAKLGSSFPRMISAIRIALANLSKTGATDLPAAFQASVDAIRGAGSEADAIAKAATLFGSRAAPQMAAAIREGKLDFKDFAEEVGRGTDTTEAAIAATETLTDRLLKLKNALVGNFGAYAQTAANIAQVGLVLGPVAKGIGGFVSQVHTMQAAAALGGEELGFLSAAGATTSGTLLGLGGVAVLGTGAAIGLGKAADFVTSKLFGWETAAENAADKTEVLRQAVEDHRITTEEARHFVDAWNNSIGRVDEEGQINIDTVLGMSSAQSELEDQLGETTSEAEANADATDLLADAQKRASAAARASARFTRDVAAANREAAQSARDYRDAQLSQVGGLLGIEGASASATEAQRRLSDARTLVARLTRQGRQGTVAYKDALEEFNSAQLDAVGGQLGLAESVAQYINENKGSAASTKVAIDLLQNFGEAAGLSAGEIDELIDHVQALIEEYKSIPETKATEVEIRDEVANRKIDRLQRALDKLRKPVLIPVDVAAGPGLAGVVPQAGTALSYAQAVAANAAASGSGNFAADQPTFNGSVTQFGLKNAPPPGGQVIENHIVLDSQDIAFQTKRREVRRGGG